MTLPAQLEVSDRAPTGPGQNERILLVEDEAVVRELAEEMLGLQGYAVIAAADPVEALAVASNERFDALVTDVVMPKMSGRALAAQLREQRADLPIVYMSGYSTDAALRDGELEPGALFLQKPFGATDLGRAVREVLGPGRRNAA
jgi:two-component system, cell cycle sensor histidine kinase and response regulator CckA